MLYFVAPQWPGRWAGTFDGWQGSMKPEGRRRVMLPPRASTRPALRRLSGSPAKPYLAWEHSAPSRDAAKLASLERHARGELFKADSRAAHWISPSATQATTMAAQAKRCLFLATRW